MNPAKVEKFVQERALDASLLVPRRRSMAQSIEVFDDMLKLFGEDLAELARLVAEDARAEGDPDFEQETLDQMKYNATMAFAAADHVRAEADALADLACTLRDLTHEGVR